MQTAPVNTGCTSGRRGAGRVPFCHLNQTNRSHVMQCFACALLVLWLWRWRHDAVQSMCKCHTCARSTSWPPMATTCSVIKHAENKSLQIEEAHQLTIAYKMNKCDVIAAAQSACGRYRMFHKFEKRIRTHSRSRLTNNHTADFK